MVKLKKGFTLIELLIVISIIAILVAAATASWRNAQMKGRDGKRKADLKALQQALETYLETNGKYPTHSGGGKIGCNTGSGGNSDTSIKDWGSAFSCDPDGLGPAQPITYMQQLPSDPAYQVPATGYWYYTNPPFASVPTAYVISALLENTNDPDLDNLPCTPPTTVTSLLQMGRNYCVVNP